MRRVGDVSKGAVPLSTVAYATQEILVILTLGGLSYLYLAPWAAAAGAVVMIVVVASYRHVIRTHPNGGGDFQAARTLGRQVSLVAASATLVSYVLLVAVAVSAGVDNLVSAFPDLIDARVPIAVGVVALVAVFNLRDMHLGGWVSAIVTALFVVGIAVLIGWGLGQAAVGDAPVAESAELEIHPELTDLTGLALVLLLLRAFAAGSVVVTGVSSIVGSVPGFAKPRKQNAARALVVTGGAVIAMFAGLTALAVISDVHYTRDPCDLAGFDCANEPQRTVIAQVSAAVFGDASVGFVAIQLATVAVLVLAAYMAFHSIPVLGSILARHRFLPRQLRHRGDRLGFSEGVVVLGGAAAALIVVFDVSVTRLVQLYLVSVLLSLTLGQAGMARQWTSALAGPLHHDEQTEAQRARALNVVGAIFTVVALLVVTITQFTAGVWVVGAAIALLYLGMWGIRRHYNRIYAELAVEDDKSAAMLPSRVHAIVLVSRLHKPTLRALAYAHTARPDVLEAVTVSVDVGESRALADEWDARGISVPLKVLDSRSREMSRPVLEYVASIRRASPREVVVVYVPEYVVGRWWEQVLHNRSVVRLKSRLLQTPGVMVTSVPWQLN